MSLTKGLVLAERPHIGNTAPTTFEDTSRFGNDGVETAITKVQLPSGLWVNSFNGTSSVISCGADASLFNFSVVTIVAWSKASELEGTSNRPIWCFFKDAVNRIYLTNPTNSSTSSVIQGKINNVVASLQVIATIDLNWHQSICVLNGNQWSVYYDGGLVAAAEEPDLATFVGHPTFYIGRHFTDYNLGYSGSGSLFNRALSPQEIADLFESERHLFGV